MDDTFTFRLARLELSEKQNKLELEDLKYEYIISYCNFSILSVSFHFYFRKAIEEKIHGSASGSTSSPGATSPVSPDRIPSKEVVNESPKKQSPQSVAAKDFSKAVNDFRADVYCAIM